MKPHDLPPPRRSEQAGERLLTAKERGPEESEESEVEIQSEPEGMPPGLGWGPERGTGQQGTVSMVDRGEGREEHEDEAIEDSAGRTSSHVGPDPPVGRVSENERISRTETDESGGELGGGNREEPQKPRLPRQVGA